MCKNSLERNFLCKNSLEIKFFGNNFPWKWHSLEKDFLARSYLLKFWNIAKCLRICFEFLISFYLVHWKNWYFHHKLHLHSSSILLNIISTFEFHLPLENSRKEKYSWRDIANCMFLKIIFEIAQRWIRFKNGQFLQISPTVDSVTIYGWNFRFSQFLGKKLAT